MTVSQTRSRSAWWNTLATYSPVILAAAIMIPRLTSAQFGLLDDGYTLSVVQDVAGGNLGRLWESGAARSRPVYWLYFVLLHRLAGPSPFWFFVGNAVLFGLTAAALISVVRNGGAAIRRPLIAGLLFVLSGPVVESYMTLSKPEPLQLALIAGSVLLIFRRGPGSSARKLSETVVGGILLLLANLTKETTLALIPVAALWLGGAWARARLARQDAELGRPARFLLAALLAGGAFLVLRARFSTIGLPEDAYAGNYLLEPSRILTSALRWGGWLVRDFAYLAPLVLLAAALPHLRRGALGNGRVLASIAWMGGWVAIYLPWVFMVEYYLLPFALGSAVVAATITDLAVASFAQSGPVRRLVLSATGSVAALFLGASVLGMVSNARQQLMVDDVNQRAMQMLGDLLPASSTLLVNHQFPGEYVEEIRLHLLYVLRREDVRVDYVRLDDLGAQVSGVDPTYVLVSVVENQPLLTVRMGVVETSVREWNRALADFLAAHGDAAGRVEDELPLLSVNLVRLLCPLVSTRAFCEVAEPIVDRRTFSYGWELYQIGWSGAEVMAAGPLPAASGEAGRWH